MSSDGIFLGVDSGTQSVKVVALDLGRDRVIAKARQPHRLIGGLPPGHMEQHPQEWASAMQRAIRSVLSKVDRRRVRGIGVSGQQHGFVPLDATGEVIRPAKLWCDTSTVAECDILSSRLGGTAGAIRAVGNAILPGYTAPKILWLRRNEPGNYRRLRQVLLPHDYLNRFLTGSATMEAGDASGTALFDIRRRTWSAAAIRAIDPNLRDWLPALIDSHEAAGMLRPALARAWGLPTDVIVSAGGGDNMMGAIGTGNVRPGVVTASLGTSGTIYAYSGKPVVDRGGEIAAFCSSTGGWLPLLCTMNVTTVTGWACGLFGMDHAALERAVNSVPPGAGGLVMLPYLAGERTPNLPDSCGVIFGATQKNATRAHFVRAAMEGATFGLNYGLRRLAALGIRPREIRLTGGGARSSAWRGILADAFGVPVVAMKDDEAAALGSALQAAWCASRREGGHEDLGNLADRVVRVDAGSRRDPRKPARRLYREIQQLHDSLGRSLRPVFGSHRALLAGVPL
jgi:xylulokinase